MKKVREALMMEDVKVLIRYRSLEARKSTSTFPLELVRYPVSIYLGEAIKTTPESAFLPFIVTLESKPDIASFNIKGEVFVNGPYQTVEKLVLPQHGRPPKIWSHLYRDILGAVSQLAEQLKVPVPSELLLNKI